MEAKIIKKQKLKGIPSASGIEIIGNDIYIIGDDSPYLFVLNSQLEIKNQILLTSAYKLTKGKIPKPKKPDFEALTSFSIGGEKVILILGSGSVRETRDKAFIVEPNENNAVSEWSLLPLYDLLRSQEKVVYEKKLNIEAATVMNNCIYLFQRGNITGNNVIIEFHLYQFIHFLQEKKRVVPEFKLHHFDFNRWNGLMPGFSGAATIPDSNEFLFTASLEDTADEWYDGAIFESLIGIIDADKKSFKSSVIMERDHPLKGKVESITLVKKDRKGDMEVLAVTDSDGGTSEILWIELKR